MKSFRLSSSLLRVNRYDNTMTTHGRTPLSRDCTKKRMILSSEAVPTCWKNQSLVGWLGAVVTQPTGAGVGPSMRPSGGHYVGLRYPSPSVHRLVLFMRTRTCYPLVKGRRGSPQIQDYLDGRTAMGCPPTWQIASCSRGRAGHKKAVPAWLPMDEIYRVIASRMHSRIGSCVRGHFRMTMHDVIVLVYERYLKGVRDPTVADAISHVTLFLSL